MNLGNLPLDKINCLPLGKALPKTTPSPVGLNINPVLKKNSSSFTFGLGTVSINL